MERFVNRLCYRPLNLSQLKKWQLQFDISHCWPTNENGLLCAGQGHNWCTGSSKSDYLCSGVSIQSFKVNCDGLRLIFHIQILVLTILLLKNQVEAIYSLLSSNRWPDGEIEQHDGSISQNICQLEIR